MGDAFVGSVWRVLVGAPVFVLGWRQACTTGGSAGRVQALQPGRHRVRSGPTYRVRSALLTERHRRRRRFAPAAPIEDGGAKIDYSAAV